MLDSGGAWNLSFTQGQSQQVITMPYQLGDGTLATYVDDEAQALEYPRAGGILGYTVAAGRQEIRVKASASDTILLDAGIKGTSRIHDFVFDAATSTSATYGVAGTFLGFDFTAKTGVNIAARPSSDALRLTQRAHSSTTASSRRLRALTRLSRSTRTAAWTARPST
jgi:hypothetical protein